MAGNAWNSIAEMIFYNKEVKWKDDKNDDGGVG